jgi:hypothetical protein
MLLDNDGNENSILYDARTVLAHDPGAQGAGVPVMAKLLTMPMAIRS